MTIQQQWSSCGSTVRVVDKLMVIASKDKENSDGTVITRMVPSTASTEDTASNPKEIAKQDSNLLSMKGIPQCLFPKGAEQISRIILGLLIEDTHKDA